MSSHCSPLARPKTSTSTKALEKNKEQEKLSKQRDAILIFHSSLQVESLFCQNPPANTFTHLFNLGKQRRQFSSIVYVAVGILIHLFVGNFLVFNGAHHYDMMRLVSTHQIREFLLYWLSYLPCDDTCELILFLSPGLFLVLFHGHFPHVCCTRYNGFHY